MEHTRLKVARWGVRAGWEAPLGVQPLLQEAIRGLEGLSSSPIGPVEGMGMSGWSDRAVGGL